jgi:outer membrane receptor protein involved in Fe transport
VNASTFVVKSAENIARSSGAARSRTDLSEQSSGNSEHVLIEGGRVSSYEAGGNVDIARTIDDEQPYYIFDSETIEQSGADNLEDFLKERLTMDTSYENNSQMYQTGGSVNTQSVVNLRGLGAENTLILVDGRRMAGVAIMGGTGQPDINGIPLAAIDRIEVLPSSASGIYGGSAVGGVINIILKKNYQGGELRVEFDKPESSHASTRTIDGDDGFSLEQGKTHVMVYGHYSDQDPLITGDRAYLIGRGIGLIQANCPNCLAGPGGGPFPGGVDSNIAGYDSNGNPQDFILANGTVLPFNEGHIAPGCIATKSLATCLQPGYDVNLGPGYGPYGLDQPLDFYSQVTSFGGTISRDMSSWLTAFASARYSGSTSRSGYNAFSGYVGPSDFSQFFQNTGYVSATYPSADIPETSESSTSATRTATAGLTAQLSDHWNLEFDYSWSKNEYDYSHGQEDLWKYSYDTSAVGPAQSFPLLFPPAGTIASWTQENEAGNSATLNDLAMRGTGPVGRLPWGEPTLAFGLEIERDSIPEAVTYQKPTSLTPTEFQTLQQYYEQQFGFNLVPPNLLSATYPNIYFPQSQTASSLYLEGIIPLVTASNAIRGVRAFEIQIADRYERYSVTSGTTSENIDNSQSPPVITYSPTPANADSDGHGGTPSFSRSGYHSNNATFGFKWVPVKDVTVRGSLATAFLPPTYSQLLPDPVVCNQCVNITDPKTGTTYLVNALFGGNPNLQPQTSRSLDAGIVFEPKDGVLEGLRVDLEHYQILQFNVITGPTGDEILSNPAFADRVTRNAQGVVTLIDLSLINAPEFRTEGSDLTLAYHVTTSLGQFDVRGAVTDIQLEDRQYTIGGPITDFIGWPDEGGEGKYKANGGVTWMNRGWIVGWSTTWFGG